MIGFKEFCRQRQQLDERLIQKGAVAAYASQGKRHGDDAVRSWKSAKVPIRQMSSNKSIDPKLASALTDIINGLIASRKQLGSVSAQITAAQLLDGKGRR
ncbi:hypothetical protein JQU17_20175 [Ponticoccus sp. SC2-23]|uniref:hypothetical protein n=1 Tax=Alexandriicola marinus TaxID=2081710 RepID=UPI000FD7CA1E|nr:hypothetical protein [Alexandriicola marinus]MBM1222533.1 hypothetical protein [Ponticoccus sp. SC6-9]MBM1227039.1 hypothetical protein [Ponticoccus sp. SC6-15]MBM1231460.1 hypothetical protein [Ponticoccus sp. SC6-38]MBM1236104.1 hypothetical protein [Ponticoccus sp. SC6-45]MBM1240483.1 hypothetical protein [Ponticoccus sp. SC6-49]MBM1245018.1 hypothetical protein [Ponticoccus sp. SC2-64]MBM1249579.1 hypothetical protein [Ponticoccus sp. SC6-42]MBM1253976.1 hypothetical protein [Pontico